MDMEWRLFERNSLSDQACLLSCVGVRIFAVIVVSAVSLLGVAPAISQDPCALPGLYDEKNSEAGKFVKPFDPESSGDSRYLICEEPVGSEGKKSTVRVTVDRSTPVSTNTTYEVVYAPITVAEQNDLSLGEVERNFGGSKAEEDIASGSALSNFIEEHYGYAAAPVVETFVMEAGKKSAGANVSITVRGNDQPHPVGNGELGSDSHGYEHINAVIRFNVREQGSSGKLYSLHVVILSTYIPSMSAITPTNPEAPFTWTSPRELRVHECDKGVEIKMHRTKRQFVLPSTGYFFRVRTESPSVENAARGIGRNYDYEDRRGGVLSFDPPPSSPLTLSSDVHEVSTTIPINDDKTPAGKRSHEKEEEVFDLIIEQGERRLGGFLPTPGPNPEWFHDSGWGIPWLTEESNGGNRRVTIVDDCVPLEFAAAGARVSEGSGTIDFQVDLSGFRDTDVVINYNTVKGTATPGRDYVSKSGSITFDESNTTDRKGKEVISIDLIDDDVVEQTEEEFQLRLKSKSHKKELADTLITGTIVDDDDDFVTPGLVLSPASLTVEEGRTSRFTVKLNKWTESEVVVTFSSDNEDVTVKQSSLSFGSDNWRRGQTVTVIAGLDDDLDDDSAVLTLSASGGDFDAVTGSVSVVVLDGSNAELRVSPWILALEEGASGKDFAIQLSALPPTPTPVIVSMDVSHSLRQKVSLSDETVTFTTADWDVSQTVTVTALEDLDGNDVSGRVNITASGGGYDGETGRVQIEVNDDDEFHRVDIVDTHVMVHEHAGAVRFEVKLDRQTERAIRVSYVTTDETAVAGLDYAPASGQIVFRPGGALSGWIDIPILEDTEHENEESFAVELTTGANGVELGDKSGRATILDNDVPNIRVDPTVYVYEGGTAAITVSHESLTFTSPLEMSYSTRDVTAVAGEDYEGASFGSVTIARGEMAAVLQVSTRDDAVREGRESFLVQIVGGGQTVVTILDNDLLPSLSINDVTISEAGKNAELAVTMTGLSAVPVGVAYATEDGTAMAGADYARTLGTLVFAPGEQEKIVRIPVTRDDVLEEEEYFVVRLSAPEHAVLADAHGEVMLLDDPLEVSIYDATVTESSEELIMPVRLSFGSTRVVSVQFAVTGGTATPDEDYEATQGLVVFETGTTEAQVRIPLIDDDEREGNETVEVTLSNARNAVIARGVATGTIEDDESALQLRVRAQSVTEQEVVFVVDLLAASRQRQAGRYRTVDGTAGAGEDYEGQEGLLEFGPGETSKEVRVALLPGKSEGEVFGLMVELGEELVQGEVVLQAEAEEAGDRARLGRALAVHVVEAVSERVEGTMSLCMPRPYPGYRIRVSHMLSGCGLQAGGERLSVWGRGAFSRLQSGVEADVVTASLGADYVVGGRLMLGMLVSRSEVGSSQAGARLQLTGWYPYVRYGGIRHGVWGLAGGGQGVVGEVERTGMRLMAGGVTGTVVRRARARLGYEADGFWLSMDGGVGASRIRAGLEGSWHLQDLLEPYVEAAVLHSGGDAERGFGLEAGGGLRVRMGVMEAELQSRRLVLHAEDGYSEWGYAGMVRYGGLEGLGAQVRPVWGRTHVGTLLHTDRPWEVYPSEGRMELEVGYGSRFRGRSVFRPHVGVGLWDRGKDYRAGAGVQGHQGIGFSVSGIAMQYMAPYRPVSYGVTASGYVRW